MPATSQKQNFKLAIIFALIASICYAITGIFVKLIGHQTTTTTIVFFRFSLGLIIFLPWFLKDKDLFKKIHPQSFILRSITGLLALSCMFYAMKYISLANALLLNNTNALFVPIVAWILLKTITPFKIWIAIIIGFLGVILILQPDHGVMNPAALVGLASGVFGGISLLQIRQLTKTHSARQILFYYFAMSTILTGIALPFLWQTPTIQIWPLLIWVGIFSAIYQLFLILSFTYAPARLMSVIMFSSVIFGSLFDWILWHHIANTLTLVGMGLVIFASIVAIYFNQMLTETKN